MVKNNFEFCHNGECAKYINNGDGIHQAVNYLYKHNKFFCSWGCYTDFSNQFCKRYNRKTEFNIEFIEPEEK